MPPCHPLRLVKPALIALCLALGGCMGASDVTGSIGGGALPRERDALKAYSDEWGKKFDANPADKAAAMNYGRSLRALALNAQAVAVMQAAAIKHPEDLDVLAAYGKTLADAGKLQEAADVLSHAHTPEHPDWSVLSAQGSVADQTGDHERARAYYADALKIAPGEPAVLSNLGLSYALSKNLAQAEAALRQGVDSPRADIRVRQNLALILALEGKFADADAMARRDLAPADAASSVAAIRQMIAQSDTWRDIRQLDDGRKRAGPRDRAPG